MKFFSFHCSMQFNNDSTTSRMYFCAGFLVLLKSIKINLVCFSHKWLQDFTCRGYLITTKSVFRYGYKMPQGCSLVFYRLWSLIKIMIKVKLDWRNIISTETQLNQITFHNQQSHLASWHTKVCTFIKHTICESLVKIQ